MVAPHKQTEQSMDAEFIKKEIYITTSIT